MQDGDACLNVELVRSGWVHPRAMWAGNADAQMLVSETEEQAFEAAVRAAEFEALDGKKGLWTATDARPIAANCSGTGTTPAATWRAPSSATTPPSGWVRNATGCSAHDAPSASPGLGDESVRAAEQALAAKHGSMFTESFLHMLEQRAQSNGTEAAVAWGRRQSHHGAV